MSAFTSRELAEQLLESLEAAYQARAEYRKSRNMHTVERLELTMTDLADCIDNIREPKP